MFRHKIKSAKLALILLAISRMPDAVLRERADQEQGPVLHSRRSLDRDKVTDL